MNPVTIATAWISRHIKTVFPCPPPLVLTEVKYNEGYAVNEDYFEVAFNDTAILTVYRHGNYCSKCEANSIKTKCRHKTKVCRKLFFTNNDVRPGHIYSRLAIILLEPDCTICLDNVVNNESKDLMKLDLSKKLVCDECAKIMHISCSKQWQDSTLGRKWEKKCLICKHPLVHIK